MSMNIPTAGAGLPDPLQNTRYEFCKGVPRIDDSGIIVTIQSPGGLLFRVHAHLLAFASGYFRAILTNNNIHGAHPCHIILPKLAVVGLGGRAEREGHVGATPVLNNQVVQLFVHWVYKRCQRVEVESDRVMSEQEIATYFFDQDENYYSEANVDDDEPLRSSYVYNDVLIGAWILGNGLRAPEFQNTIMSLLYAHTEYVLSPRERCELALQAFLSPPSAPLYQNAYPSQQHQQHIASGSSSKARLHTRFEIPPGSALERFLVLRAGAYILCPQRAGEFLDDAGGFGGGQRELAPVDLTVPLLRGMEGSASVALTVFLAEELSKRHYGIPGVMMHQDEKIYV
ncbi:hypothetical protein F5X99DRAFT_412669 [Biscogniauxia marginata]|nr:hypothetical protein F5X99DRAFT_412669 [Biscogniauxia marginata]